MRRALETTYLVLKDHPNFNKMRFIIHPGIREKLGGADDVPSQDIQGLFAEYQDKFTGNLDAKTFWRYTEDEPMWYAHDLDEEGNERIQKKVEELGGPEHLDQAMYLDIRERYPQPVETLKHVHNRIEAAKKDIESWLEKNPIGVDEKIAVVAHSMTFRFWIAEECYWQ